MNATQLAHREAAIRFVQEIGINAFLEFMGPLIGRTMQECARRVIDAFPIHRLNNEFEIKRVKDNGSPDWVGKADKLAQAMYEKLLVEDWVQTFGFGLIGEENDLRIECTIPGVNIYFTCDPYDGTGAMERNQSHGIGTMCALVCNGRVVAAIIGDTHSQEIYYYRPGSPKTHRIMMRSQTAEELVIDTNRPLAEQALLLRSMAYERSELIQLMVMNSERGRLKRLMAATIKRTPLMQSEVIRSRVDRSSLFKKALVANGSIGISMAMLCKGEVGGAVMALGNSTPWDTSPVIGLSLRLGFDFYYVIPTTRQLVRYEPTPPTDTVDEPHEIFVCHSSRRDELINWGRSHGTEIHV